MVVNRELIGTLQKEPEAITKFLKKMEKRSKSIIPQLMDRRESSVFEKVFEKPVRYHYYAAWKMSPAYHKILKSFTETGSITNKPWHQPMEGFFQAFVDTHSSKDYEDCSEFSLICYKTGTSHHVCKSN